jgi:hypothetical protein
MLKLGAICTSFFSQVNQRLGTCQITIMISGNIGNEIAWICISNPFFANLNIF